MSYQQQHPYAEPWPPYQQAPAPRRRRRRVFPWVFLAVQALFVIWVIAGIASGARIHSDAVAYCHAHPSQFLTFAQCVSGYGGGAKAGTAIGAALIVGLWVAADVILGTGYVVWRLARRGA